MSMVIGGQCRRPARSMVLPLGCGREPLRPEGDTPETLGRVQPTHYYVRVSRAETFTGVSLASYRQMRAPPCAALDHRWGVRKPGRCQGAKGTLAAPSVMHGPSAGGEACKCLPDRGPTSGRRLAPCGAERGLAPDPSHAHPVRFPWWNGGCHVGAVVHQCDLIHLRLMVSISLFLRV